MNAPLTVYVCEGEESEIKAWFKTINIAGVPLNEQELNNAVYSGPFVTRAKEVFSNSQNAAIQKWSAYSAAKTGARVRELLADDAVTDKRGVFEYLLGGETETRLLNARVFKPAEAKAAYRRQTDAANCQMLCRTHNRAKGNR